jgi:hypothetical protein
VLKKSTDEHVEQMEIRSFDQIQVHIWNLRVHYSLSMTLQVVLGKKGPMMGAFHKVGELAGMVHAEPIISFFFLRTQKKTVGGTPQTKSQS